MTAGDAGRRPGPGRPGGPRRRFPWARFRVQLLIIAVGLLSVVAAFVSEGAMRWVFGAGAVLCAIALTLTGDALRR